MCQFTMSGRQKKPAPHAQWMNGRCRAGRIIGFDNDPANRRALRRTKATAAQFGHEAVDRFFFFHADDTVVIATHAGIGLIRRAIRQNLRVRRRHMRMCANDKAVARPSQKCPMAISRMSPRHAHQR